FAGCSVSDEKVSEPPDGGSEATNIRLDPPSAALIVEIGKTPPAIAFHVFAGDRDVTAGATLTLTGATIGAVSGATVASDGATGGAALVTASYEGSTVLAPITARVTSSRLASGAAANTLDAFDAADNLPYD